MEFQKIKNLIDMTSDNTDLPKKRINMKKNYSDKEKIKIEKPIIAFSINHDSIA